MIAVIDCGTTVNKIRRGNSLCSSYFMCVSMWLCILFDQREIAALQWFPVTFVYFSCSPRIVSFILLFLLVPVIWLQCFSLSLSITKSKFLSSLLNFLMILMQHMHVLDFIILFTTSQNHVYVGLKHRGRTLSHAVLEILNSCMQLIYVTFHNLKWEKKK